MALIAALGALAPATPALSQQQLPGITVQGATLDPPPVQQPAPQAAPAPQPASPPPTPAPKQQPAPKKAAPAPQAASSGPAPTATSPPAPPAPVVVVDTLPSAPAAAPGSPAAGAAAAPAAGSAAGGNGTGDGVGGVAADRTGTSTTVLTRADLEQRQIRNAAEALRSLPGVTVSRSGGFGALTQVRIRGNEGNHTLVRIDGIDANDVTNGEFDFSDLATADIERIEVIRGPQSGLYGSGAAGGVINIVTRSGKGPLRVTAHYEGGRYSTSDLGVSVSGGTERIWGAVTANQRATQGFNVAPQGSERDGSKLATVSARGGVLIADGLMLTLSARHSRKRADYDEFGCDLDPVTFACRNGALGTAYDANNRLNHSVFLGGAQLQWDAFDGALTQILKASLNDTRRRDVSEFFGFSANDSRREKLGYSATWRFATPTGIGPVKHFLTGLLEAEKESFTPSSDFGFGFAGDGVTRGRNQRAAAAEYRAEIAERLFLSLTGRRDETDAFGGFGTWRTSASWKAVDGPIGVRPHASYGTGIKLPTMFEQYGSVPGFYTPNANLRAERIKGWDAGVEFILVPQRLSLDVTYFSSRLDDKIGSVFLADGTTTAVNLDGTSTRRGVEIASRWAIVPTLSLGAAYTFTDAKTPDGVREIRRPPHSARFDVNWAFASGRGVLNTAITYNGAMTDLAFSNLTFESVRVGLSSYWLATVSASYALKPGVEVFGRVENAFNARYQEVYGYATPGVAAYGGIRVTIEDKPRTGTE